LHDNKQQHADVFHIYSLHSKLVLKLFSFNHSLSLTLQMTQSRSFQRQSSQYRKIHKHNTTQKKQTTQNTAKQNYPGSVASYDTRPGNKMGLFYNVAHTGFWNNIPW